MLMLVSIVVVGGGMITAQNSYPAPGGNTSVAAPGGVNSNPANGIGWNPGPTGPGMSWGGPWGGAAPMIVNAPLSSPDWQNSGIMNVVACGYDAQGVWRTLPLRISYTYNGATYNVEVINAWNPWTDMWNYGVDMPAYSTSYYLNGQTFGYYAPLSTGTYYFNL